MGKELDKSLKEQGAFNMWMPERPEEELRGEVLDIIEGQYGKQYVIKTSDGEVITPSHKVLQGKMQKAQQGKKVHIIYDGEVAPTVRGQSPTRVYRVGIEE